VASQEAQAPGGSQEKRSQVAVSTRAVLAKEVAMSRKMITVHRQGYTRAPYHRKDGTYVSGTSVPGSTFKVRDRGKHGRTPKSQQFFDPQVHMGWHKGDKPTTRRRRALIAHGGDYLATARALIALHNVTVDPGTKRAAGADARYFFAKHNKRK